MPTDDTDQSESQEAEDAAAKPQPGRTKRFLSHLYRDITPRWLEDDIKADIGRHKAKRERKRAERASRDS
jgi:hypothetical protein